MFNLFLRIIRITVCFPLLCFIILSWHAYSGMSEFYSVSPATKKEADIFYAIFTLLSALFYYIVGKATK